MTDLIQSVDASIQSARVKEEVDPGLGLIFWNSTAHDLIPPWWSTKRDMELRDFWKAVDYLSGAVYTIESRMTTIPFKIVAEDMTSESQQKKADAFHELLMSASEFGKGWEIFFSKWTEDLLTQDNGAFAEIIGPGKPDGPLTGAPFSIAHLDASRCQRTSNAEFPVIYQDRNGDRFRLHFTRVAYSSLQPSPIDVMNGVGFCSLSRCLNIAQNLLDILVYQQEKLGSRPHRNILLTGGGLDPDNVSSAFKVASEAMDNQVLSRYSKSVVIGSSGHPDASLEQIDLSSLPDGFDKQTDVTLGMATIALAFGVDARELFPAMGIGATRADALIQHLKARGKGIGQLLQIAENEIGPKFLPPDLKLEFDFQDDAQDKQVADIKKLRSDRHTVDLTNESLDERTVREQMLSDGDISQAQFDRLELQSGRLPDGVSALSLYSDPEFSEMLELAVPDPLNVNDNDIEAMKSVISEKRVELITALGLITNHGNRKKLNSALAALDVLEGRYEDEANKQAMAEMQASIGEEGEEEEGEEENVADETEEVEEEELEAEPA